MEDKIVTVSFNVWASSEEEAQELKRAIGSFVDEQGRQGRKVTAAKLTAAIQRWQENPIVRTSIINYFK